MIRVYRYGLCPPLDWDDECTAEMVRLDHFRNRLIDIEEEYQAEYRRLTTSSEVEAIVARLDAASEAKDWAAAKELRAELKSIRAQMRTVNTTALSAAQEKRKADVKKARQTCQCYWSSYNAVIQSVELARSKAAKEGRDFHRRDHEPGKGSWRITCQIQGGASLADIISGKNSQLRISLPAHSSSTLRDRQEGLSRKKARHGQVSMVVHNRGGLHRVTWPLMMHRPIPTHAIIVSAQITKTRRLGTRWDDWRLCVTVREPDPAASTAIPAGINIGWRRLHVERGPVLDGAGLRVAVICGDDGMAEITLPEAIISAASRCYELTSAIDKRINDAYMRIVKDFPSHPEANRLGDIFVENGRLSVFDLWRFSNSLVSTPTWLRTLLHENNRDRRERNGLYRHMAQRRKDIYRVHAKAIAEKFGAIAIAKVDWSKIARIANSPLPPVARGYRKIASPGEFEAELRRAVKIRGGNIIEISDAVSFRCSSCGNEHSPSDRARLHHTCPDCGASWDVDFNAARNLFAAVNASGPKMQKNAEALASDKINGSSEAYVGRFQRRSNKISNQIADQLGALENAAE